MRMWSSLPRDFQAVIVPRPASGSLYLKDIATGAAVSQVALPAERGNIFIYVKRVLPQMPATVFACVKRK